MADPLSVPCPDCLVPAGQPCATSIDYLEGAHADRRRIADLRALEHGTCALCGRPMVRGSVEGSPVDAWHPAETDAAACPPIPDPRTDWDRYAMAVNLGLTPGHPGVEHFLPDPAPPASPGPPLDSDEVPATERPASDPGGAVLASEADLAAMDAEAWLQIASTDDDLPVCPECRAGKPPNCDGQAWDTTADAPTTCTCSDAGHPEDVTMDPLAAASIEARP